MLQIVGIGALSVGLLDWWGWLHGDDGVVEQWIFRLWEDAPAYLHGPVVPLALIGVGLVPGILARAVRKYVLGPLPFMVRRGVVRVIYCLQAAAGLSLVLAGYNLARVITFAEHDLELTPEKFGTTTWLIVAPALLLRYVLCNLPEAPRLVGDQSVAERPAGTRPAERRREAV